ncbi:NAD-binding protein [Amycolatopsis sp. NPDC051373]|uniref:NAD-binding protein n=1 Tax=Amycolatopsis sp. NPDC051373 TaxID=3155801 RepID=UPI0034501AE1
MSGHVMVLGYVAGRTEGIVCQLLADGAGPVVLAAADDGGVHPMPGESVEFVRGDLTDEAVLRRAGADRARVVLVDVVDDNATLAVAVNHLTPGAHVVVTLQDLGRASLVRYVNGRFRCVQWHSPRMVTEELVSPGIADVYAELMTEGGASTYSTVVPESAGSPSVELCRASLRRRHGATLLAVRDRDRLIVNRAGDTSRPRGATVYYVASERLSPQRLVWSLRQEE